MSQHDAPLQALLLPFASGVLPWPAQGAIAFLGARAGGPLSGSPLHRLRCEQDFKPLVNGLRHAED